MKLFLSILITASVTLSFSQSSCLTSSCWFYSRPTTAGYLPPDGVFTFLENGTFTFNNYLTGNTHGGNWRMTNSTDVLLHYTSTTASKLNSDNTLKLKDCSTLKNGETPLLRMDQVNFISSKTLLDPNGFPWKIFCRGQLMN